MILLRHPIADALTGSLRRSRHVAAESLAFLVPAAFVQLLAAIAASALAARDDYGVAAIAYAREGSQASSSSSSSPMTMGPSRSPGRRCSTVRSRSGCRSWRCSCAEISAGGNVPLEFGHRLWGLVKGSAVPIAIQGLFVVCLRFAANLGVGKETIFSYGYLIASVFAAVTAGSVALVSSAPLTRRGLDPESAAAHVVNASWLSLAVIAAAAGVFALAARFVGVVLGSDFSGDDGQELGRLVVYLTPWMFASVVYTLTFPLVFIAGKHGNLVPVGDRRARGPDSAGVGDEQGVRHAGYCDRTGDLDAARGRSPARLVLAARAPGGRGRPRTGWPWWSPPSRPRRSGCSGWSSAASRPRCSALSCMRR